MTIVKICGITNPEDAIMASEAGADMLGFNFYPPSPRSLSVANASSIAAHLRHTLGADCPLLIGVFVNESAVRVREIVDQAGLDAAQLSGDETVETIAGLAGMAFKTIRPSDMESAISQVERLLIYSPPNPRLPSMLLDAYHPNLYGGTGEQASGDLARNVNARVPRLMLAGGLNPDNVNERVKAIQPWGVDVASGVELDGRKGFKDADKVKAFIDAAQGN